jgi:hypothetical protein
MCDFLIAATASGGYQRLFTTQMTVWNNKPAFATGG